jgi:hypothetical protein
VQHRAIFSQDQYNPFFTGRPPHLAPRVKPGVWHPEMWAHVFSFQYHFATSSWAQISVRINSKLLRVLNPPSVTGMYSKCRGVESAEWLEVYVSWDVGTGSLFPFPFFLLIPLSPLFWPFSFSLLYLPYWSSEPEPSGPEQEPFNITAPTEAPPKLEAPTQQHC